MERPGKFHLDDMATRTGTCYMSILSDSDEFYRPWRFANRRAVPANLVLFPRIEGTVAWIKRLRSEIGYRARTAVAALRGQITEWT